MKPVLILENQAPENNAYLGTFLKNHDIAYEVINAELHGEFPASIDDYCALAVMGGDMSANDPLLNNKQAEILILQAMYRDIPVIGHCLGGQLMAKALGAKVRVNDCPEIGWQPIEYVSDIAFEWFGYKPTTHVMQWHYDTFELPNGCTLLASSKACKNQAFMIGKHLAMQFHIEIDDKKLNHWVSYEDKKWDYAKEKYSTVQNKEEMLKGKDIYLQKHKLTADNIYTKWLESTEVYEKILYQVVGSTI